MPIGPFVEETDATAQPDDRHQPPRRDLRLQAGARALHARAAAATSSRSPRSPARSGFPGGATYCATKHAVVGLSEAIRAELRGTEHRAQRRDAGRRQHRARLGPPGDPRVQDGRARGRGGRDRRGAPDRPLRASTCRKSIGSMVRIAGADAAPAMEAIGRLLKGDQVLAHPDHRPGRRTRRGWPRRSPGAQTPSRAGFARTESRASRPRREVLTTDGSARELSQSAIRSPICGPASSCRKWLASAITWSISPPSAAANRRPVSSGSTGSESAHRNSFGRVSPRSASSTRWPAAAPGMSGRQWAGSAETPARRPSTRRSGTAPRRRRSPRRRDRSCRRARTSSPTGRSSVRSTKLRNAIQASFIVLVAGEQARVEHDDPGDPVGACSTATRSPIGPPQSCTTTVASRRSSSLEQRQHAVGVAVVAVPVDVDRLVRAAEARQVGSDAAIARVSHRRDHLAPQKRPRRLAVEEHDRRAVALVEMGEPQARRTRGTTTRTGSQGARRAARRGCGRRRSSARTYPLRGFRARPRSRAPRRTPPSPRSRPRSAPTRSGSAPAGGRASPGRPRPASGAT